MIRRADGPAPGERVGAGRSVDAHPGIGSAGFARPAPKIGYGLPTWRPRRRFPTRQRAGRPAPPGVVTSADPSSMSDAGGFRFGHDRGGGYGRRVT